MTRAARVSLVRRRVYLLTYTIFENVLEIIKKKSSRTICRGTIILLLWVVTNKVQIEFICCGPKTRFLAGLLVVYIYRYIPLSW